MVVNYTSIVNLTTNFCKPCKTTAKLTDLGESLVSSCLSRIPRTQQIRQRKCATTKCCDSFRDKFATFVVTVCQQQKNCIAFKFSRAQRPVAASTAGRCPTNNYMPIRNPIRMMSECEGTKLYITLLDGLGWMLDSGSISF
jgi:hypothetical protein